MSVCTKVSFRGSEMVSTKTCFQLAFLLFCLFFCSDCELFEDQYTTNVTCSYDLLNVACPESHVIAIQNITVGAQLNDTNCPTITACCERRMISCEFDFPLYDFTGYFLTCNAQQSCNPSVQPDLSSKGNCSDDVFFNTSYMFWGYYCIPESRAVNMTPGTSHTIQDSTLYLWNDGYPSSNISSTVQEVNCSIQTNSCLNIHIHSVELSLATAVDGSCSIDQYLTISSWTGEVLYNWTCHDNTYRITTYTTTADSYLTVTLTNTNTGGDAPGEVSINCPAIERVHCLSETSLSPSITTSSTAPHSTTITSMTTSTTEAVPSTTTVPSTLTSTSVMSSTEPSDSSTTSTTTYSTLSDTTISSSNAPPSSPTLKLSTTTSVYSTSTTESVTTTQLTTTPSTFVTQETPTTMSTSSGTLTNVPQTTMQNTGSSMSHTTSSTDTTLMATQSDVTSSFISSITESNTTTSIDAPITTTAQSTRTSYAQTTTPPTTESGASSSITAPTTTLSHRTRTSSVPLTTLPVGTTTSSAPTTIHSTTGSDIASTTILSDSTTSAPTTFFQSTITRYTTSIGSPTNSSTSTTTPQPSVTEASENNDTLVIVLITVVVLLIILLLSVVLGFILYRRRNRTRNRDPEPTNDPEQTDCSFGQAVNKENNSESNHTKNSNISQTKIEEEKSIQGTPPHSTQNSAGEKGEFPESSSNSLSCFFDKCNMTDCNNFETGYSPNVFFSKNFIKSKLDDKQGRSQNTEHSDIETKYRSNQVLEIIGDAKSAKQTDDKDLDMRYETDAPKHHVENGEMQTKTIEVRHKSLPKHKSYRKKRRKVTKAASLDVGKMEKMYRITVGSPSRFYPGVLNDRFRKINPE